MAGKSLRLTFKGDKVRRGSYLQPAKRKRSHQAERRHMEPARAPAGGDESDPEMYGGDDQAWVTPNVPLEVSGPCFVHQRQSNGNATALTLHMPLAQVGTSTVEPPEIPAELLHDGATVAAADVAPHNVHQVWVATQIPNTGKWTLKSAEGTFLSCDQFGGVSALNEARGPQEEWVLQQVVTVPPSAADEAVVVGPRSGFAWKSMYGGYLSLEAPAPPAKASSVRADEKTLQAESVWDLSVQWKFRHARRRESRATTVAAIGGTRLADEMRLAKTRQGWNAGTLSHFTPASRRELLQAQREGRLAEAMLDHRAKLKSDKYTKVRVTADASNYGLSFSARSAMSAGRRCWSTTALAGSVLCDPARFVAGLSSRSGPSPWFRVSAIMARVANSISRFSRSFSGSQNE